MGNGKRCCICDKRITQRFWICNDCEIEHDLIKADGKQKKPTDWPDWIRELYNIAQRDGYRNKVKQEMGIIETSLDKEIEN